MNLGQLWQMEIHSIRETIPQQIMLEITNQEESVFFFCRNVYIPESLPWYHHWQLDNNAEIKKGKKINKLVNQVFAWDLWRTSTHVLRVAFIIEPRIEQIEMLLFEKKYASFPRQEKNYVNNKCNKRIFIFIFSMKLQ